mgnify:CR=1 FL=1
MKVLIDMNLSPDWTDLLNENNVQSIHWKDVGSPNAADEVLMAWAKENRYIVFTHDLDFGAILRFTQAESPSVIQVRTQDVSISHLGDMLLSALKNYQKILEQGALIIIDEDKLRTRILPLK